jgi:hypothetical protein
LPQYIENIREYGLVSDVLKLLMDSVPEEQKDKIRGVIRSQQGKPFTYEEIRDAFSPEEESD